MTHREVCCYPTINALTYRFLLKAKGFCMKKKLVNLALCTFFLCEAAFPAAFQLYELGTPVIGTAGVGQAALASDASTAYFNPAGMTQLPTSEFMLGTQVLLPYAEFGKNNQN